MSDVRLRETSDGSHTLYSDRYGVTYHSEHGALRESLHVFIERGLNYCLQETEDDLRLLECGFGSGLNAWLTAVVSLEQKRNIHYTACEPHPLSREPIEGLNYPEEYMDGTYRVLWDQLHRMKGEKTKSLHEYFSYEVHETIIQDLSPDESFDLIYHDAFGPRVQPELWDYPLMKTYCEWLYPEGVMVTFGAQGAFKRHLTAIGFDVEALPGPPGKREMTRAIKTR